MSQKMIFKREVIYFEFTFLFLSKIKDYFRKYH